MQIAPQSKMCRARIPGLCKKDAYCDGTSFLCPEAKPEPDDTKCGDMGEWKTFWDKSYAVLIKQPHVHRLSWLNMCFEVLTCLGMGVSFYKLWYFYLNVKESWIMHLSYAVENYV